MEATLENDNQQRDFAVDSLCKLEEMLSSFLYVLTTNSFLYVLCLRIKDSYQKFDYSDGLVLVHQNKHPFENCPKHPIMVKKEEG